MLKHIEGYDIDIEFKFWEEQVTTYKQKVQKGVMVKYYTRKLKEAQKALENIKHRIN